MLSTTGMMRSAAHFLQSLRPFNLHLGASVSMCSMRVMSRREMSSKAGGSEDGVECPQPPYSILMFATDGFGVPSLRALAADSRSAQPRVCKHIEVVSPSRPAGRSSARTKVVEIPEEAAKCGIRVHRLSTGLRSMKNWTPPVSRRDPFTLIVAASFGYFIPESVISSAPAGGVVLHPSLLPLFRGAAPISAAMKSGNPITGVTVAELSTRAFDIGRVLCRASYPVRPDSVHKTVYDELALLSSDLLLHTLAFLPQAKSQAVEQCSQSCWDTRAPKVKGGCREFDPAVDSSETIYNEWRRLGTVTGVQVSWNGRKMLLVSLLPPRSTPPHQPKCSPTPARWSMLQKTGRPPALWVLCADGKWIGVTQMQLVGRKPIKARDFANGHMRGIQGVLNA